ncbi:MAG TPA: hypothetical protein VK203_07395 [Nostocaceae cyanobacterium]|nr:hypothetical protein [Nostocaceae cyanobacterium]
MKTPEYLLYVGTTRNLHTAPLEEYPVSISDDREIAEQFARQWAENENQELGYQKFGLGHTWSIKTTYISIIHTSTIELLETQC